MSTTKENDVSVSAPPINIISSLRGRLSILNIFIVALAIIGLGYYMVYRNQQASSFLTGQLEQSVEAEAQNSLSASLAEEAALIENYFLAISRNMTSLKYQTEQLLGQTDILSTSQYWDASLELTRNTKGHWDNPNDQLASVFVSTETITSAMVSELNAVIFLDFIVPPLLDANPEISAIYFIGTSGETVYYPNIDLAALLESGHQATHFRQYAMAKPENNPEGELIWTEPYNDPAGAGSLITHAAPLFSTDDQFMGVVAGDLPLAQITDLVRSTRFGESGYSFLIDSHGHPISLDENVAGLFGLTSTDLTSGEIAQISLLSRAPLEIFEILAKMVSGQRGVKTAVIDETDYYIAYRSIPAVNYSLGIIIPADELRSIYIEANERLTVENQRTLFNAILITSIILSMSLVAFLVIGNTLTAPLSRLTEVANKIAAGDLKAQAAIETQDEIGLLAKTLNSMSSALSDLITGLETRVAERTRDIERRTNLLQTAVEVGGTAASERDLRDLLSNATRLISERFGFYHVGIFLLDEKNEYAVLRAANSEGGVRMLSRGHRLKVGEVGIVGYVAKTGQARIALDVGVDAVFFDNPDLPETRSEMSLPLIAGGMIVGVLDVQSTEPSAFFEEDIATLHVLADLLAISIDNARLFEENRAALEAARRAYGELSKREWQRLLEENPKIGYISLSEGGVIPIDSDEWPTEMVKAVVNTQTTLTDDERSVALPIRVREQVIGAVRLTKASSSSPWTPEEIQDAQSLADILSESLESVRLYQEAQKRAARELVESQVASRIRETLDTESILQTAAAEIQQAFNLPEVLIHLVNPDDGKPKKKKG